MHTARTSRITAVAWLLFGLAVLVAAVAVGAVAYDIVVRLQPAGGDLERRGASVGIVIGIVIRTVLMLAAAAGLLILGLRIFRPDKYSMRAIHKRRLAAIAEELKTQPLPDQPPEAIEFLTRTDAELLDIYHHIDRKNYLDRFNALAWVICHRDTG